MSRNQNQNNNRNNGNRRETVKRFCAFIAEKGAGSKPGTIIKHHLPAIKQEVGEGIFIAYMNAEKADLQFDDFLADHPELAKMPASGAGWYLWSFSKEATIKAKSLLAAAAQKWEDDRRAYEERKAREQAAREQAERDSKPIMVEDLPPSAFPALAPPTERPVATAWGAQAAAEREARAKAPPKVEAPPSRFVTLTRRDDMFEQNKKKAVIVDGWEQED